MPTVTVTPANLPYSVSNGQTDNNHTVDSGGSMFVAAGRIADVTSVLSSGLLTIDSRGIGSATTVFSGGTQIISGR